jgi:uncharacterized protein YjbJ (UPF0337 family)
MSGARRQEALGTVKKLKGRGKEVVGIVTGDRALQRQGSLQRAEGAAQESLGKTRRKVGELVEGVAKAIKE